MQLTQPTCRSGDRAAWFWFLGTKMVVRADTDDTNGAYGLIEQELPEGFGPPPHIHHAEDEQFLILDGQFTFFCAGRAIQAGPGSFVCLPRGVPHRFVVERGPARLLQFTTPAGLERFFVELGTPVSQSAMPPDGPPDVARMAALASAYRIEFVSE